MYSACFPYFFEQFARSSLAFLLGWWSTYPAYSPVLLQLSWAILLRNSIQLLAQSALWFSVFNRTSVLLLFRTLAPMFDLFSNFYWALVQLSSSLPTPHTLELRSPCQAGWIWGNVISQRAPPDATSWGWTNSQSDSRLHVLWQPPGVNSSSLIVYCLQIIWIDR